MAAGTQSIGWTIADWAAAYANHQTPQALLSELLLTFDQDEPAWIWIASEAQLDRQLAQLAKLLADHQGDKSKLPLYGVPFAIKDNIDAKGWSTTAACPAYQYQAEVDATVVANLQAAGAILLGKTNLDQFATGLVGTRSPYGAVPNTFNPEYVSGGSSSGSASVVARGLVTFSLGTDTAGSGRVPAGFNNIVGLKPTRGWLSTAGVIPACRSLDCVSVFALTVDDAVKVAQAAGGFDAADPYSRQNPNTASTKVSSKPKLAIPDKLEFFGDKQAEQVYLQSLEKLQAMGCEIEAIDYSPFSELAELLYYGPWVAERTVVLNDLLKSDPDAINPVVANIVRNGEKYSACDTFAAEYKRQALARTIQQTLSAYDALVVPTTPTIRTLVEIEQEPVAYNSQFGTYTNFTNLADLSALALPSGFREDGLPAGITLIASTWHDQALADLGKRWQEFLSLPLGATGRAYTSHPDADDNLASSVKVAVVGAHLTGMPLNFQLTTRDAVLIETTKTAPEYKLYALPGTTPPKPGLARDSKGESIIIEIWEMPIARFGEFVREIPPPLGIGNVKTEDGRIVKGFICEPWALEGACDITHFGGWRAFIQNKNQTEKGIACSVPY
ncbi:allophanate hydrolase [Methylobacillus methanolivorans]|uniref:Allophanate hydrolase n=1 Tax=Methylobacillus methanolivorans TaxID=1848927 RepID=A0ABW8GJG3_9PROT